MAGGGDGGDGGGDGGDGGEGGEGGTGWPPQQPDLALRMSGHLTFCELETSPLPGKAAPPGLGYGKGDAAPNIQRHAAASA